MIIVGIDPGKVTGIATWWSSDYFEVKHLEVDTAEVEASTVIPVLRRMLDGQRATLIAVERFTNARGKVLSSQPDADRVLGAVRSFCDENLVRCVYQSPGPAKKLASKPTLRRIGWYTPTPDNHANDALSHVLLCLASFYPQTFAKIVGL